MSAQQYLFLFYSIFVRSEEILRSVPICVTVTMGRAVGDGLKGYYKTKIEELELLIKDKTHNLRRLEAQRNELNTQGDKLSLMHCRKRPGN